MRQPCTYWAPVSTDEEAPRDSYGNVKYPAPIHINVRWEELPRLAFTEEGEHLNARGVAYCPIRVEPEGYLKLGTHNDADPLQVERAYRIRAVESTPNLRNTKVETKAWLSY